jgi:hypothetical protein
MSLKRGKYSKAEDQFVIDNVHKMTVKEIAAELGRATDSVESLIRRKRLKPTVGQDEEDDVQRLLGILHTSPHWEKILIALTQREQALFEKDWISMIQQFGEDVWYTEEKYIVDWILLDIKKYRTLKVEKDAMQEVDRLELELAREYKLDPELRNATNIIGMEQQLAIQKGSLSQHTENYKKILDKIEKISEKLKANREERRDIKANEDTFWGYITMLEDEKYRKQESRQAQLMRMAQDKAREDLYEYHSYMDGVLDIPLLTPEIVIRKKEEERDEYTKKSSNNV